MSNFLKYTITTTLTLLFLVILVSPEVSLAQSRFVPCDGVNSPDGVACQACHLVEMGSNVFVWLIGILFVVFGVVAAVAGFGLVTSAGNQSALSEAKKKLINAFIGIVLVLAAWLIVDTIMQSLVTTTYGFPKDDSNGNVKWYEIECVNQPGVNKVIVESSENIVLGAKDCDVSYDPADPLNPIYDCTDQIDECRAIEGATATQVGGTVECDVPRGVDSSSASRCDTSSMETINFLGHRARVDSDIVGRLQSIDSSWNSSMYRVYSVGSYNCRKIRGSDRWSIHSYGVALDINPDDNPHCTRSISKRYDPKRLCGPDGQVKLVTDMPASFIGLFTSRGFGWGGNWSSSKDAMHYSAASSEGGWISID